MAQKLGRWNWSATNKVAMSLMSKPVRVDEKEKDEFKDVAMLHVSPQRYPTAVRAQSSDMIGPHRGHR